MKKYNENHWYVNVKWTGTFNPKSTICDDREQIDTFEFDHLPTETEIVDSLCGIQWGVIGNPDWKNLRIVGYTIMNPITPKTITL